MQEVRVQQIAVRLLLGGGVLPLLLERQARPLPARVRVGLVVADVAPRRGGCERACTVGREDAPALAVTLAVAPPVRRRLPAEPRERVPTVREPVLGVAIAAGLDELEVFAAGDGRARELEGR